MQILEIDLQNRSTKIIPWDEQKIGSGILGALLLNAYSDLDHKAPSVVCGGAIGGFPAVGLGVSYIVGLSAQSGDIAECKVEGRLASTLRHLNCSAIVIRGSSSSLTCLKIDASLQTSFINVENLIDKNVKESNEWFHSRFGHDFLTATIGISGTAGFAYSSIVFDDGFPTASGGLGSDWGKRNLKMICFEVGSVSVNPIAKKISDDYLLRVPQNPLALSELNSPGMGVWPVSPRLPGYLGAHNFSQDVSAGTKNFDPIQTTNFIDDSTNMCIGCPQSCLKKFSAVSNSKNSNFLHQQALVIWYSQLGMTDLDGAMYFNSSCHETGVEHGSMGTMLAFLAESSTKIEFGDHINALRLLTGWHTNPHTFPGGTGNLLKATSIFNRKYMMHVKANPLPPWDPRGAQGLGLIMAINPSGPRYDIVEHDIDFDPNNWPDFTRASVLESTIKYGMAKEGFSAHSLSEEKVYATLNLWNLWSAMDAIGVCTYAGPPTRELSEQNILDLYIALTSDQLSFDEFIFLGKLRIYAQQIFNIKNGFSESRNTLPKRFFIEPVKDGPAKGIQIDYAQFVKAKKIIYQENQWSDKAIPKRDTAVALEFARLLTLVNTKIRE
jgi:aldehyde:ferredoxin oxidoreductase